MVRKQLVRKRGGHVQRRGGHVKSQNAQEHPPGKQNSTSEAGGKDVKHVRKQQDASDQDVRDRSSKHRESLRGAGGGIKAE